MTAPESPGHRSRRMIVANERHRAVTRATGGVAIGILPLFLLGIVAPVAGRDLQMRPSTLGYISAAFFLSSAVLSIPAGLAADSWRADKLLRAVVVLTPVVLVAIASAATTWYHLVFGFALLGVFNAFAQPSANVLFAKEIENAALGRAMGVKASASPIASMLAGILGPAASSTLTWRWVLGAPSLLLAAIWWTVAGRSTPERPSRITDRQGSTQPLLVAASSLVGAASTSILSPFLAVSVIDAGLSLEFAAICLFVGSLSTVVVRLSLGAILDRTNIRPLHAVVTALALGGAGILMMSFAQTATGWLLAVILAFGAGWGWPGALHAAIAKGGRAGHGTGSMQAGTYLGGVAGAAGFGLAAERLSFDLAWMMAAGTALIAATLFSVIARRSAPRST